MDFQNEAFQGLHAFRNRSLQCAAALCEEGNWDAVANLHFSRSFCRQISPSFWSRTFWLLIERYLVAMARMPSLLERLWISTRYCADRWICPCGVAAARGDFISPFGCIPSCGMKGSPVSKNHSLCPEEHTLRNVSLVLV